MEYHIPESYGHLPHFQSCLLTFQAAMTEIYRDPRFIGFPVGYSC